MYFTERHQTVGIAGESPRIVASPHIGLVGGNVLFLGLTSLFTDISSEMVAAILPVYLTFELRFSALQFGLFDGLYQGMTAVMRLAGGVLADRHRRYKTVAATGYTLSTGCRLGLWLAHGAWAPVTAFLFLDRIGKGVRTPPRDALIALSSSQTKRAEAFGVHRTLDATGALLGPILAFSLLGLFPGDFSWIFLTSFGMGVLGLSILVLFVDDRKPNMSAESTPRGLPWGVHLRLLQLAPFRRLMLVGALLNLLSVSDAFVYLTFQRLSDFHLSFFPLLYLGTALVYLILAVPLGRLADRIGPRHVFLGGHVGLLGVYGILLIPGLGLRELVGCLLLLGLYYAATDGVLVAFASHLLPQGQLTSGLALLTTATILARFVASILYGALWSWQGPQPALSIFIAGLAAALLFANLTLTHPPKRVSHEV